MSDKPSYMSYIPAEVRYDEELSPNAKLLFAEITSLANANGYCWATNDYFARLYGTSDRSVKRWIKALSEKGYVFIEMLYKSDSKEVEQRRIYINKNVFSPSDKFVTTPSDKNVTTPSDKNVLDNNTSINNTSINRKKYIKKDVPTLEEVQEYISEKGYQVDAKTFFEYYDSADWHDTKGKPVKNWKQRVVSWNGRKENNGQARKFGADTTRQTGVFDPSYADAITEELPSWYTDAD